MFVHWDNTIWIMIIMFIVHIILINTCHCFLTVLRPPRDAALRFTAGRLTYTLLNQLASKQSIQYITDFILFKLRSAVNKLITIKMFHSLILAMYHYYDTVYIKLSLMPCRLCAPSPPFFPQSLSPNFPFLPQSQWSTVPL